MNELLHERADDRIRLVVFLDGPLTRNMDVKAADLQVPTTALMGAAIDWYSTELADPYRILTMDELPPLPDRPESTNWPSNGTTGHFLLPPEDYAILERHMEAEKLSAEECGVKALRCYLFGVQADELDVDEIRGRYDTDEYGFIHSEPPLPDPRDE
jgi:hypothetical protein